MSQEGEYEFYSWRGDTSGGPGSFTMSIRSDQDFSKRFKVLGGRAVYLGNLHFAIKQPRFGIGNGNFVMKVADLRDRDLPLLYAKHPNIVPDRVVVAILPN